MTNERGLLIVVSGPSGAGKGTICKEYLKNHPDTYLSVSATTRAPRTGETIQIAASRNPVFKAGKAFKDAIK